MFAIPKTVIKLYHSFRMSHRVLHSIVMVYSYSTPETHLQSSLSTVQLFANVRWSNIISSLLSLQHLSPRLSSCSIWLRCFFFNTFISIVAATIKMDGLVVELHLSHVTG